MLDRGRLSKLMAMTTSDNDNEALAALRLANAMLAREKATWEEVLAPATRTLSVSIRREPYQAEEAWVAPHLRDEVVISAMFAKLFDTAPTPEFMKLLKSVHSRWIKHGNLTQGQYQAIRNAYNRAVRS